MHVEKNRQQIRIGVRFMGHLACDNDGSKPDFGFYGKGLEGYVHYKTAVDRTSRNSGGGNGGDGGGNGNGGCLSVFVLLAIAGWVVSFLLR